MFDQYDIIMSMISIDGNLTIVNEYMQSYLIITVLLLFVYLYVHKYIILTIYNSDDNL